MNIAYVCADRGIPLLGTKGASVHVRAITGALAERGHQVHVLCARLGDDNSAPAVDSIRHCVTQHDLAGALCDLAASSGLGMVLERYALDSGAARQTTKRLGIPLVLEVNAPLVKEAARWRGLTDTTPQLANERHAFQTADAIVVVSRALAAYVKAVAPLTPTHWISNGAAVDRIAAAVTAKPSRPGAQRATVVGFTGSMKRWHGLHELLDAFTHVRSTHADSVLVLAGTGPEEPALRERVSADPTLRNCVQFTGGIPHDDIPALLATFDIGVAPYLATDDFYFSPLKVVEYLAAGLPVVHPRLGDLCEIVADAGISYDPNEPTGLACALDQILRDPARPQRSATARSRAAAFSWDATAAAVEDVLHATMSTRTIATSR
jgi:glycosyltransferase involved in cell wall biosynthesis